MKLKVCGMKYNTSEVAALKPDYLGFIFWGPSARYFDGDPSDIPSGPARVGVFVNARIEEVILRIREFDLDAVQLHGNEAPVYCKELRELIASKGLSARVIIKAFAIDGQFNFNLLLEYEKVCDYFLFDTSGDKPGGTGKSFDWQLLKKYGLTKPYFLSGGIGSTDTETLSEFFNQPEARYCYAIDINSKFEIKPGLKNTEAIKTFKNKLADGPQKN